MRLLTFSVLKGCGRRAWPAPPAPRALCSRPEPDPDWTEGQGVTDGEALVAVRESWGAAAPGLRAAALAGLRVLPAFVSESEEAALLAELEPALRRMRYQYDHWDNAIHGYRETERAQWSALGARVLARVLAAALPAGARALPAAHVLDLAAAGHVKPHVDAVRFCGDVIAGLSLLSPAVLRLQHERDARLALDALLPRRSLYIMSGVARYEFTHAVLGGDASEWRGRRVVRRRRVAIVCRSAPAPVAQP